MDPPRGRLATKDKPHHFGSQYMRAWPVVLIFALVAAGCLSTPSPENGSEESDAERLTGEEIKERLTEAIYTEIIREEAVVEGADDTQIWLDLYRPADADEGVPVILVKTPYQVLGAVGCEEIPPHECPYTPWLVEEYAPRGYAVAFADVRGNHNSGGCIDQSGPKQWQDGYNVVEWLGGQEWSNGKVGMYGASYDGETQFTTALLNPPSLKTIVPTASVSNQYEYSFYDGVPYTTGPLGTTAAYLAISLVPGLHENAITTYPERLECQAEVFSAAVDHSGDWSEYWEDRDYRTGAPEIDASVLHIHGLQDWNVKPNHVDPLFNDLTSEKRLILGQWGHSYPDRDDWRMILHRWFDHYLHGIDTGILQDLPPVLIEDTEEEWRGIDAFPPLESVNRTYWLTPDAGLSKESPADSELTLDDHPRQVAGEELPATNDLFETITDHPSELVFETEPLENRLNYTGRPVVHLSAATDAESTYWAVHLESVAPDGESNIINRGYFNTRHIDGLDDPRDLTPGEPYTLTVRMFPQDDVIPAGNQLRLVVTNTDPWIQQDTTYAASQLRLGADGTRLELPLSPEGTAFAANMLREDL